MDENYFSNLEVRRVSAVSRKVESSVAESRIETKKTSSGSAPLSCLKAIR